MKIEDPKTRRFLFSIGVLFIALGSIGILINAPWGNISNSIFTIFGTTISFAQFSVGFSSLKSENKSSTATRSPDPPRPITTPANVLKVADQPVKARLISTSGPINLKTTWFSIGRAPDNQQVLNDSQASGHHAVIHPEGQGYALVDQGSTNGTWLNGQRLESEKPHLLHSGDVIRIGNTTFTYEVAITPITTPTVITPVAVTQPPPSPPSYTQPVPPVPLPNGTKRYIGSGIVLLAASLLNTIMAPFTLILSNTPVSLFEHAMLVVIYILASCGIKGLYQKQADKAGWPGQVGTLMLTAGWLLNVLTNLTVVLVLSLKLSGQSLAPGTEQGIYTLYYLNIGFTILGDFIFGISMIRAAVYPLWISIILLGVGSLNIIVTLAPTMTVFVFTARLLTAALFCGWGIALMQLPNRASRQKLRKDLDKSYGVSRSGGPSSSASSK